MRIYPIFLPFAGCAYRCVYCDQYVATSIRTRKEDILASVKKQLSEHIKVIEKGGAKGELAFYGGTFTAIDVDLIRQILKEVETFFRSSYFTGLRFSTRPDTVSDGAMEAIAGFPISMIELGVQSLNDPVLRKIGRPYRENVVRSVVEKLKARGLKVGIQLMAGLPKEDESLFMDTINKVIEIRPDAVRIYPTLVFPNAKLSVWYQKGLYRPLSLQEAIRWCAFALLKLEESHINVIRIGLQANSNLDGGAVIAGPYHPSFGYLTRVHWWRLKLEQEFEKRDRAFDKVTIYIPKRYLSEFYGPRSINIRYLKRKWKLTSIDVKVFDSLERNFTVTY